jgi:ribosomal protein S18 acetylase RimI-like enzyme
VSLICRPMRQREADAIAAMLRQLPRDLGLDLQPKVTGGDLLANDGLVHVTVAEDSGLLLGACVWLVTYSTWRASKGMYLCDLYVMEHKRGLRIGERLLRAAAREAAALGSKFIKLEVSRSNPRPAEFYTTHDFKRFLDDDIMYLEEEGLSALIKGSAQ